IADVKASQVLFDEIARMGGQPLMWRTGHSLIKTKMAEVSSPLAGEMSGHIFFADRYYGYDDALYSAIRTLGITSLMQGPLSDWTKSIPRAQSTPELRIDCEGRADKHEVVATIKSQLVAKGIGFNDLDGLRVTYPHGWWLIRASNTQEVLVARAEAQEDEHLQALVRELSGYLSEMNLSIS
ncbi:MAG: phosphomannomutase, partial [Holosporales bacterium]